MGKNVVCVSLSAIEFCLCESVGDNLGDKFLLIEDL